MFITGTKFSVFAILSTNFSDFAEQGRQTNLNIGFILAKILNSLKFAKINTRF